MKGEGEEMGVKDYRCFRRVPLRAYNQNTQTIYGCQTLGFVIDDLCGGIIRTLNNFFKDFFLTHMEHSGANQPLKGRCPAWDHFSSLPVAGRPRWCCYLIW